MADLRFGISFQTERLALIREIARNLVGEARPGGSGTVGGGSVGGGAIGTTPTGSVGSVNEPDVAGGDDTLLADRAVPREDQARTVAATRLAGLRLPQPMFLEPQAYRQLLSELAKSDPVLAAMVGENSMPDVSPADPNANPAIPDANPDLPDTNHANAPAGHAKPAASAVLGGGLPIETAEVFSEAPLLAADANPVADPAAEPMSAAALRREAEAASATDAATATGATRTETRASDVAGNSTASSLASSAATPAETAASEARAATESVVEQALSSLGLAEGAASTAMRTELGGIIASFILNAHFQPGWPPLRPVQDPEAKAFVAQLAKDPKLSKDDLAMLTYLANFGLNRAQLMRILKMVAAATNRSKLLQSIAQLFANIGTILGALQSEIEALADEIKEAHAGSSKRERLTLR